MQEEWKSCGHEKTARNTYTSSGSPRCRTCYNRCIRDYRRRTAAALRTTQTAETA